MWALSLDEGGWEEKRHLPPTSSSWRSPAGSQLAICAILVSSRVPDAFVEWWWWCEVHVRFFPRPSYSICFSDGLRIWLQGRKAHWQHGLCPALREM